MNKFLTAVFAATLLSSTALAEVTIVAKPGEKTITLVCSDDVLPGTVVLSNPPKVNCKDFGLAKTLIGTGVTIGPDVNVDRITRAVRRATLKGQSRPDRSKPWPTAKRFERFEQPRQKRGVWQPLDGVNDNTNPEFAKKFPGIARNREFFISGTSSCRGWVPVQDIVNGKCRDGKVKVD